MSVQVAIVDDHEAVRLGFAAACEKNDLDLIASAPTVTELLEQIGNRECQVVVTDLSLADGSAVSENVERIVETGAAALVLLVSILLPQLIFVALDEVREGSYTTWHIAAIGTLLAIVTVRKFELVAWIGMAITVVEVLIWGGPDVILFPGW